MAQVPVPVNETVLGYAPGSKERAGIESALDRVAGEDPLELTATIDGVSKPASGDSFDVTMPSDHVHVLGHAANATRADATEAIDAALSAAPEWADLGFEQRASVFLRAADLLAGPWRDTLNAATMLGQGKTVQQAEIDAACELIDFWRFNVAFARRIGEDQPISSPGVWNRADYRPLEGFVYAITPFNFTSIAGNLPTSPALLGNVVIWKPSPTQQFAAHFIMRLLEAAGLPPGFRGHPLHRLDQDLPAPVAAGRSQHRPLSDLSAAGRGDRWQGLRGRPRQRRSRCAACGTGPGSF